LDHHTLITMKRITVLFMSLLVCGVAQASSAAPIVKKPDLAAGEAKATQVCAGCHAVDGSRGAAPTPILQGQHPDYLVKQLREFKEGKRKNAVMSGMAAALSDDDMRNVSAFYASKMAKPGSAKNEALSALGEKIFRGGVMAKSVAACAACHSPNGAGMPAQYPRLAGQHRDYTKAQLVAFRQGERTNSVQMSAIAANLSDKEIDALADYIAGLR
jgi:cytochrome c553